MERALVEGLRMFSGRSSSPLLYSAGSSSVSSSRSRAMEAWAIGDCEGNERLIEVMRSSPGNGVLEEDVIAGSACGIFVCKS